jgi:hypothetical protein
LGTGGAGVAGYLIYLVIPAKAGIAFVLSASLLS